MSQEPVKAQLSQDDQQALESLKDAHHKIRAELSKVIVGQDDVIQQLLIAIFRQGHCLLEGVPGLAKTLMVSTLARRCSCRFSRIQFTPDLMPSDITGTEVIQEDKATGTRVVQVPARAGVLRTSFWRTKSTARRRRRRRRCSRRCRKSKSPSAASGIALPAPFFVLATQNPIEQEGTYTAAGSPAGPLHVQGVREISELR